jgi:hypothetical protein
VSQRALNNTTAVDVFLGHRRFFARRIDAPAGDPNGDRVDFLDAIPCSVSPDARVRQAVFAPCIFAPHFAGGVRGWLAVIQPLRLSYRHGMFSPKESGPTSTERDKTRREKSGRKHQANQQPRHHGAIKQAPSVWLFGHGTLLHNRRLSAVPNIRVCVKSTTVKVGHCYFQNRPLRVETGQYRAPYPSIVSGLAQS